MEKWISINGYESQYEVSNYGNVRSKSREINIKGSKHISKQKILKSRDTGKGYLIVTLYKESKCKNFKIHRLVIENFIGPNKLQVDHIDGNRSNNNLNNLRYCTSRQNKVYSLNKNKTTSKYVGVYFNNKKWIASCTINGIAKYLGSFNCEFKAHIAYVNATK